MPRPKKPEKLKKKKVSITLDPELLKKLKREAEIKGLSLSEYIEQQLRNPVPWDIKQFGRFIQALNTYNGYKVYPDHIRVIGERRLTENILDFHLENKTITVEFWLKNSKGGINKHKAVLDFYWCIDCPGAYVKIKLYGWDDKKKEWFEMGEESFIPIDGQEIFNAILRIRRDFWLKLKTFHKEKKKKKSQKD